MEVPKDQVATFLENGLQIATLFENGLHDSAQMLGCFLVSSPTVNAETNLHLKAESQALLGDSFFREREYRRAIHNYKQALQYYKMLPKQNTPSSRSSLSSNRSSSPNSYNASAINENEVE